MNNSHGSCKLANLYCHFCAELMPVQQVRFLDSLILTYFFFTQLQFVIQARFTAQTDDVSIQHSNVTSRMIAVTGQMNWIALQTVIIIWPTAVTLLNLPITHTNMKPCLIVNGHWKVHKAIIYYYRFEKN